MFERRRLQYLHSLLPPRVRLVQQLNSTSRFNKRKKTWQRRNFWCEKKRLKSFIRSWTSSKYQMILPWSSLLLQTSVQCSDVTWKRRHVCRSITNLLLRPLCAFISSFWTFLDPQADVRFRLCYVTLRVTSRSRCYFLVVPLCVSPLPCCCGCLKDMDAPFLPRKTILPSLCSFTQKSTYQIVRVEMCVQGREEDARGRTRSWSVAIQTNYRLMWAGKNKTTNMHLFPQCMRTCLLWIVGGQRLHPENTHSSKPHVHLPRRFMLNTFATVQKTHNVV